MWNFLFFLYQDVLPLHEISTAYVHSLAGELKGIRCKTFDVTCVCVSLYMSCIHNHVKYESKHNQNMVAYTHI